MRYVSKPKYIDAIQWTGTNLKEVIEFTGKHEKFDEWFPTWEAYEKYVRDHDNIFKIIFSGSPGMPSISIEVNVGSYIIKINNRIDGYMIQERFEQFYEPVA